MQTPFIVNGKPFFVLGGQVHNSSGYGGESMQTAWRALEELRANTAEVPVYWEQVEPQEGQFTFAHLDEILQGARQRGLRLVLLWFATWKNGSMQYAPGWVKSDPQRFHPVMTPGGKPLWVLSSHCQATFQADRKAFSALLAHLQERDADQRTVIAVQIENEPGILAAVRDYGQQAEQEYQSPVPDALLARLKKEGSSGGGPVFADWLAQGHPDGKDWAATFGPNAPEYFTAWSVARYIDGLAEAGKAVYDLPLYVNVWLRENGWWLPGVNYPSGGPASTVLDLWKWAAPHIDLIAPDIYIENPDLYAAICQAYRRPDNPLFVPESGHSVSNAVNLFEAIARFGALGYAMFGIESIFDAGGAVREASRQAVDSFRCVAAALPLIEQHLGTDKLQAVVQREFLHEQRFDFGRWLGLARFPAPGERVHTDFHHHADPNAPRRGRGLIFTPSEREFYLVGGDYRLLLREKTGERAVFSQANDAFDAPLTHYLSVEEGHFDPSGAWVVDRRRNGDEITSGLWVTPEVGVVHAVLA